VTLPITVVTGSPGQLKIRHSRAWDSEFVTPTDQGLVVCPCLVIR
jgi:hypothetical protein